MNHAPHLYIAWQQLVEKSKTMRQLATEGLWEELIASEMEYVRAVHQVAELTQQNPPASAIQDQLKPLLRAVLDNEAEVKRRLQLRMDELARLVGQSSVQKSVLTVYGKQGGHVLAPQSSNDSNH
ncbi:flagella biosynthesis regulatory protein FliT [Pseudocitrobacter cyperus]|uniref:Flagellar protein FliT n=1 Tax=Pseudocitrobacter cyperus TaxID=3112843 RepID=A0ABV0HCH6_9ENTR